MKTKIHIFHTGSVKVDQAIPLHEKNPLAVTGFFRSKKKKRILPVSAYLIENEKGKILIDTGWDSKYATEKPKQFFGLVNKVSGPIIKKGESVDCKLNSLGLKPSDIDYVFYSHLDFDHVSGTAIVADAKNFMVSEEELKSAEKGSFRYMKELWSMVNLKSFAFVQNGIGPVGKSYDVFGDKKILLINTPGHSFGHTSVKISGDDGKYVIIGGDAAYLPESFENQIIPGFTVDNSLAEQSLKWLTDCKSDSLCLGVFVNHDPSVKEQILEV